MASYQAAAFSIELPDDAVDASVHAFAFPQGQPFTPTLSVRIERRETPTPLAEYVEGQLKLLAAGAQGFSVLRRRSGKWHGRQAYDAVVEMGPPELRIRQRLVYAELAGEPQTIYILTASDAADSFPANEDLFNRVILSFVPRPKAPPPATG